MHSYSIGCCLIFLALACATAKPKEYDLPPDLPEIAKVALVDNFEKGKVLYKVHCTDCHGIFTKGKLDIPNFTVTQIDLYSREALLNPSSHAVMKRISQEQLNMIITFLRYRHKDAKIPVP